MGETRVQLHVNTVSTIGIDLNAVPFDGTVIVHPERCSDSGQQCVLSSPNYSEIVSAFEKVQTEVGDYHHIYLEGIQADSEGKIHNLYPVLGS